MQVNITEDIRLRILQKDEEGLRLLYQHFGHTLYGIAFRMLNNHAYAEDALQKCFLKVWNGMDQFDPARSTLFTWMARIIRNVVIDMKRLRSYQLEAQSETIDPHVHANKKVAHINTARIDTSELLDGLEEKYAFVLEHLYLKGYSQSELSEAFDIPLGTIKTRVKKALDILKEKLNKEKGSFLGFSLIFIVTLLIIL